MQYGDTDAPKARRLNSVNDCDCREPPSNLPTKPYESDSA